jgi:hypothetical protein
VPPHCDSLDGPVVRAAHRALDAGNVDLVLPFVPAADEAEVIREFDAVMKARTEGPTSREVADRHFFETVVRLHRMGEGAAYTGLKPAGLDVGPVIPVAERAIESDAPVALLEALSSAVRGELAGRFVHVMELKRHRDRSVVDARKYVTAMLGLQVWAHGVFEAARAQPHGDHLMPDRRDGHRH